MGYVLGIFLGILILKPIFMIVCSEDNTSTLEWKAAKAKKILADAGYLGDELFQLARKWLNCIFKVAKLSEEKGFIIIPSN